MTLSTKVSAGNLDRRVTVEVRTVGRDPATGAELVTWPALRTVWAQVIESATANDEEQRNGVLVYSRPTRVRIVWCSDVGPTNRLNIDGRLLQIIGTAEIGMRQYLELACREWSHE